MEKVPIRLGRLRTSVHEAAPRALGIRVSENDGPSLRPAAVGRVCRVCTTNEARYTCPRCNLPYCSVACYRAHGESCTEAFYHDHVANEMSFDERATAAVDPKADRQRAAAAMLTRVKQFHDETDAGFEETEEEIALSTERLAELALLDDTELSLEKLTDGERARFLADVAGGRMSQFVVPWEPWWRLSLKTYERETSAKRRTLIIEVVEDESNTGDHKGEDDTTLPPTIEAARFPSALFTRAIEQSMPASTRTASPTLTFHAVEIFFAYAFTMRTFNGDWTHDPEDAALTILHASAVLREDARHTTLEHVVLECLELRDIDGTQQPATNKLALADAAEIMGHDTFALDALTDMIALVEAAADDVTRTRLADNKKPRKSDRAAVRMLRAVQKKVEFYRVWCFHNTEACSAVAMTVSGKLDGLRLEGE